MTKKQWIIILLMTGSLWLPVLSVAQQGAEGGVTIHVVQRGETLFRIAQSYGMTVDELATLNGLTDPNAIQVGQRLLVPAASESLALPQTHQVQGGETLRSIAELYNLSIEQLVTWNGITDPNRIFVGQVLNLFAPTPSPEATLVPVPTSVPPTSEAVVAAVTTPDAQSAGQFLHTVQRGETLYRIARSYGLTVNDLVVANQISDPTLIYAGQQLIIPGLKLPDSGLLLPPSIASVDVEPLVFVEGQTARVRIVANTTVQVNGAFLQQTLPDGAGDDGLTHTLLAAVPLGTAAGQYPFTINVTDASGVNVIAMTVMVVSGGYGNEVINLLADRSNLLDPNVEAAELAIVQQVTRPFTPTRYWTGTLGLPAAAPVISAFGPLRSYNGGAYSRYHTGTDFAGAPGTPILAAASGTVVLVDKLNVRGNATIIDHGWGVYTGYWHQTEQYVQIGEFVTEGQVIGTIGSTGRVTGPHLHWEVWVSGYPVNPMQWVTAGLG